MEFKKNADGSYAFTEDHKLIQIGPDGSEKPWDPEARAKQIAELTEKASKRGAELDRLNARYAALAEIEDIAAYMEEHRKNAETVASMADKDREKEAGVQKRISEAVKAATTPITAERDDLKAKLAKSEASLNAAVIGNAFATSAYVSEKLQSAAGAQKLYGDAFYVKDGKAVGRDPEGNDIYGSDGLASFDEALASMVEGGADETLTAKYFTRAFLQASITDWQGFYDAGGNEISYSPEMVKEVCECDPEFANMMAFKIRNIARLGELEERKN